MSGQLMSKCCLATLLIPPRGAAAKPPRGRSSAAVHANGQAAPRCRSGLGYHAARTKYGPTASDLQRKPPQVIETFKPPPHDLAQRAAALALPRAPGAAAWPGKAGPAATAAGAPARPTVGAPAAEVWAAPAALVDRALALLAAEPRGAAGHAPFALPGLAALPAMPGLPALPGMPALPESARAWAGPAPAADPLARVNAGAGVEPAPVLTAPGLVAPGGLAQIEFSLVSDDSRPAPVAFYCTGLVGDAGARIGAEQISFEPPALTLAPGLTRRVSVQIAIPAQAAPGLYAGLMRASQIDHLHAVLMLRVS